MSSGEENETHGPKMGIKLSLDQANLIIKRHFANLIVKNISHIKRGYNNRVYIVTTSDDQEFVLRLSGRFWTRYKTENEVAALVYISKCCESVPVPKVYGYCTNKEKSGINAEYILMQKVPGEPLELAWNEVEFKDKMKIVDQIVMIFSKIQGITFPKLGSFEFKPDPIGDSFGIGMNPDKDFLEPHQLISVEKGVEFDGGPFMSFLEYFKSTCETEIEFLRKCTFMKQSDGYSERLKRIETFVAAFDKLESVPEGMDKEALQNVPFVFTHGDLEPRNLMVDRETLTITGVLDWEFSGSYPVDEEWFTGFEFVDCDTSDWRVFNNVRPASNMDDEDGRPCDPEVLNSIREYFLGQMRKNGAAVPDDIPGHMIRAELYYFKGFICPWWLREKRDPVPETHYEDMKNTCKRIDIVLEKYGY